MSESATIPDSQTNNSNASSTPNDGDVEVINELRSTYENMKAEMAKVIVGQDEVVENLLITILSRGHALLMGVPGLAKTLMVNSLSKVMSLDFNRIQFTPDLMPSDITGTDILQETVEGRREFEFVKGPIFANIILADEINRTPPKTQSALLEAMQEHHVTVSGRILSLPEPFFVLATQNPIEQEGTYALPEAQLDRFMFFVEVKYPDRDEELRIARETTGVTSQTIEPQVTGEQIIKYQKLVERVPVPEHIYDLAVDIVRSTRPASDDSPDFCKKLVSWGAGPRAVQYLIRGSKARAVLHGSYLVRQEDLEAVAHPVLRHRIITNFQAQAEGTDSTIIVEKLLDQFRNASA
ncbi:MAG: MoxR family ATPase [Verrucomicrobiota bacterium]|nr:MoxR family ATPase [Verrucomicrobiota bacterium]MED5453357.1 MoxR family ATPase [Verrucomicrobiota bacterium]|tara:strand:+ start:3101 stop:4156 length:1056 start_codon:yes stop_codon:yes gene_type:complete